MTGRRVHAALLVFGIFTLITLAFATSNYATYAVKGEPEPWWPWVWWSAAEWYSWALLVPFIVWVARTTPLDGERWRAALARHLAAWLVVHAVLVIILAALDYVFDATMRPMGMPRLLLLYGTKKVGFNLLVYAGVATVAHAMDLYARMRERERRALQLETQLTRAQLEVLKSQLQPHFLFNTLHAISALMPRDILAADRVVTRLGDLLRLSLQGTGQEVSLRQELEFLRLYLDIQETRFPDRLTVVVDTPPDTLDALVPSLLLQPLVENGIRHAIEPRAGAGTIVVRARRSGDRLAIEVTDDGPGIDRAATKPNGNGIGLANTRQRLEQLYGADHRFALRNQDPPATGLVVALDIPFRLATGHA